MQTKTYVKMALTLGLAASLFYVWYWFFNPNIVNDSHYAVAVKLVWPHLAVTWLATALTAACLVWEKKALVILAAGLYALAVALVPDFMMFVIIQAALMFTAYLKFGVVDEKVIIES